MRIFDESSVDSTSGVGEYELNGEETKAGITYVYARTTAALEAGKVYILSRDGTVGSALSTSNQTGAPLRLCVPQIAVAAPTSPATYSFAWVAVKGPIVLMTPNNATADVELFTTSVAGQLHISGGKLVSGLKLTTAATTSSALNNALAGTFITLPTDA